MNNSKFYRHICMAAFSRFLPVATDSYGAVAVFQCLADALAAEWHPLTSINCKRLVSASAHEWSVAMPLGGQMRCNYAEPMRVGMRSFPARVGLAEKAPRGRLATATVATSVATLQTRCYAGCRRCRRCRQINHHSILGVIFGYLRRSVSAHRIGTTLWSLV